MHGVCAGQVGVPGWVYRVGSRVGNTGTPSQLLEEQTQTAERAPDALQGREWVVWVQRTYRRRGRVLYHPPGPVGAVPAPPCTGPLGMPPPANRGEIRPHFL